MSKLQESNVVVVEVDKKNGELAKKGNRADLLNGDVSAERYSLSLPGSPTEHKSFKGVVGSAESLVGRVLAEQGLAKYCDEDFVRSTSRELQEALNMTKEEIDRAAHRILLQERRNKGYQRNNALDRV